MINGCCVDYKICVINPQNPVEPWPRMGPRGFPKT